jgi:hypothetical protein
VDNRRFDALTRGLAASGSRRGALGAALGAGLVALFGSAAPEAAAKCSKRKPCGPCRRCKKGTCKRKPDGTACDGGTCRGGTCEVAGDPCAGVSCPACQACVDGACAAADEGNACGGGRICRGGACACPAGQERCGDACVDTATDRANCGACGVVCPAGETCGGGSCRCGNGGSCRCGNGGSCGGGLTCCAGGCAALDNDPRNCGACGNVCPGIGQLGAEVSCRAAACDLSCQGETYDVNGDPADGCEQPGQGGHARFAATRLPPRSCTDRDTGTFSGRLPSDARVHANPPILGFDPATGAAPLWWAARATGGAFCATDLSAAVIATGATNGCYELTVETNRGTWSQPVVNGAATISRDPGAYGVDSDVFFTIRKTCGVEVREVAAFEATFHL